MRIFLLIIMLAAAGILATNVVLAAATDAVFLSVSGKVTVKNPAGKVRVLQSNSTAAEGETVQVGEDGKASLVFFDGSTLDAKPHTQFVLATLQKPSSDEKKLRFTLLFGGLLARVQKLMTATSQFEIEAGGIVCGVRGTEFSLDYDPSMGLVDLKVLEGSVYAKTGGITTTVPAGQERKFLNGSPMVRGNGAFSTRSSLQPNGTIRTLDPGNISLALDDLSSQFMGTLSINGNGGLKAPALGGSLQSGVQLMGGAGTIGIVLPGLSLKLLP